MYTITGVLREPQGGITCLFALMVGVDHGVEGGLRPFSISEVAGSPLSQNHRIPNAVFVSRTFFVVPSQLLLKVHRSSFNPKLALRR